MNGYTANTMNAAQPDGIPERACLRVDANREPGPESGPPLDEVLDRDDLLNRVGGDTELLHELVELFVEDSPPLLHEMRRALGRGDFERFSRAAHALAGMARNFSAAACADAALKCELSGADRLPREAAESLIHLEREMSRLHAALCPGQKDCMS